MKMINKLKKTSIKEMYIEAKWIYKYAIRYKFSIFFYTIMGVIATVMGFGGSIASKNLIDAVTGYNINGIGIFIILIIFMGIGSIISNAFASRISFKINILINNKIQADTFDKIIKNDWESMSKYHSGDLINRLNGDINNVSSSILGLIPGLIMNLTQFLGTLSIIIYYDSTMALLAVLSAPISLITSNILMKGIRERSEKIRKASSDMITFLEEAFQNLQCIKAFNLDLYLNNKFKIVQNDYSKANLEYNKISIFSTSFMSVIGLIVSYVCLGWGIYRLWSGYITFGTMILFLQLSGSLSSSFSSIVKLIPSAISATISARRIMTIIEISPEKSGNEELIDDLQNSGKTNGVSIELAGVQFNYHDRGIVLKDVNIYAAPHEIIALIGPSGEGKTTIMRMLLGLLNVTYGDAIIRNDSGIESNISASTRRLFDYVPQGNSIFTGTIAENIRMVKQDATDEEIREVLKKACAYEFVEKLPDEINCKIGERGTGFSEGQGQRLAIARALIRNSPILLLDEATSALDIDTERKILNNIMTSKTERTCIISTHRSSILNKCDRVYRIQMSKVEELSKEEINKIIMDY